MWIFAPSAKRSDCWRGEMVWSAESPRLPAPPPRTGRQCLIGQAAVRLGLSRFRGLMALCEARLPYQPVAKVIRPTSGVLPASSAQKSLAESTDSATFPRTDLTKNPLLMERSTFTTGCYGGFRPARTPRDLEHFRRRRGKASEAPGRWRAHLDGRECRPALPELNLFLG